MFYATEVAKGLKVSDEMCCGKFKAKLMCARRLVGDGIFSLPSGTGIPVYPIAALPGCPENWVREEGSYVCPVDPNWGLWFSWTDNDHLNTAILPSVKGMNPVTGEKLEGFQLKSYRKRCPTHDIPFVAGSKRFCEKCNFEWPPQSYICAPNTLWWDGFRQPDGTVRQFFFSEDEVRDVASTVIGKENTVPAFGFAFFEPVKRREPPPQKIIRSTGMHFASGGGHSSMSSSPVGSWENGIYGPIGPVGPVGVTGQTGPTGFSGQGGSGPVFSYAVSPDAPGSVMLCSCDCAVKGGGSSVMSFMDQEAIDADASAEQVKEVAVGAGARIKQDLEPDTLKVRDWQIKPSAVMRLYFVFREEFKQIVAKGTRDIVGDNTGFLKGLPVG